MSFWQLIRRAQLIRHVLLGYQILPRTVDEPIQAVICPIGLEERSTRRVWNTGDGRVKFIILQDIVERDGGGSSGVVDEPGALWAPFVGSRATAGDSSTGAAAGSAGAGNATAGGTVGAGVGAMG